MRKRQISPIPPSAVPSGQAWLDVDRTAFVEVKSEENGYPIESALLGVEGRGWRAANSGTQTIRLIFDEPQQFTRLDTTEDYALELSDVTVLELIIVPDKSGGAARASLVSLRLV